MTVPAGVQTNTGGGGGQPFTPHPTVPYGQEPPNGGAPAVPTIPAAFVPPAPPAVPALHPTVTQGQPGAAAPSATQPPAGVDPNATIQAGPGVPQELVGRTYGQAFQIYSALATDYLKRNPAPAAAATTAPVAPAAAPAQPATDFWRNPEERIAAIVEQRVAAALAPMTSKAAEDTAIAARDQALVRIPDHQELWPEITRILGQATPEQLADPSVWETAADMARGRKARVGIPTQNKVAQFQGTTPGYTAPLPSMPAHMAFSEGPSVPSIGNGLAALTPAEEEARIGFGMTVEAYQAWKAGASRGRR